MGNKNSKIILLTYIFFTINLAKIKNKFPDLEKLLQFLKTNYIKQNFYLLT